MQLPASDAPTRRASGGARAKSIRRSCRPPDYVLMWSARQPGQEELICRLIVGQRGPSARARVLALALSGPCRSSGRPGERSQT